MELSETTANADENYQTIILDSLCSADESSYEETSLPFADGHRSSKETTLPFPGGYQPAKETTLPFSGGHQPAKESSLPFSGSHLPAAELPPSFVGNCPSLKEPLPEKLREMRRLFKYGRESVESRAKNFYRQALFMQEYEDNCPWPGGDFVCYFPTYHDLSPTQLRGYFTWRAAVRRESFQPIAASAAYIYLYELLNDIGTDSPEDTLKKLRAFELGYINSGIGDKRMRNNLHRWMLEYAVVKGLPPELVREYADPDMMARDNSLAILRKPEAHSDDELFTALCVFGGKKVSESPVIKHDPARGRHLFSESWRSASTFRRHEKKLFSLCFGERKTRHWYPLFNAVYYEKKRPEDKDYVLNQCRSFHCKNGIWTVRAFETLSFNKARLQGFLHTADARLRRYLKTGRYLKERPEDAWAIPLIDAVIESDKKLLAKSTRPIITIDFSGLEQIRREADGTRDRLLTEEEIEDASKMEYAAPEAERKSKEKKEADVTADVTREATAITDKKTATFAYKGEDTGAKGIPLDRVQIQILTALLKGRDASGIIRENHRMPAVEADTINEAFFDEIGDNVLLCEGDVLSLMEDYREDIIRCLE